MAAPLPNQILAFGGPDHQNDLTHLRWNEVGATTNTIEIINGKWRYGIIPGLGGGTEVYGRSNTIGSVTGIVLIPFQYRYEAQYDATITVMELIVPGTTDGYARRINMPVNQRFQLTDGDENIIDQGSANDLSADTEYDCLWYVDLVNGFDRLWVDGSLVLEADNFGNVGNALVEAVNFGTSIGKGIPSSPVDKFFICNIAVQASPTTANGIGSADVKLKMPSGAGNDNGFDASGSPSYLNVDEIPADDVATDIGDADGEQQSYAAANVDGGDVPLAFQIDGAAKASHALNPTYKAYLKTTGGSRAYGDTITPGDVVYRGVTRNEAGDIWITLPNGDPITEAGANALEVGVEIVVADGHTLELDQIGLSYLIEGARSLPGDFPVPPSVAAPIQVMTY